MSSKTLDLFNTRKKRVTHMVTMEKAPSPTWFPKTMPIKIHLKCSSIRRTPVSRLRVASYYIRYMQQPIALDKEIAWLLREARFQYEWSNMNMLQAFHTSHKTTTKLHNSSKSWLVIVWMMKSLRARNLEAHRDVLSLMCSQTYYTKGHSIMASLSSGLQI